MIEPTQQQTADQSPLIVLHSLSVITAQVESLKDAPLSRQEINFQSGEGTMCCIFPVSSAEEG